MFWESGNLHGDTELLMEWANADDVPSLSPDEPSGVEISIRNFNNPVLITDITSTLALTKLGLQND